MNDEYDSFFMLMTQVGIETESISISLIEITKSLISRLHLPSLIQC